MMSELRKNLKPFEIVSNIVNTMLRIDRKITLENYAINVVEHYLKSVPGDKRNFSFHFGLDTGRDAKANTQLINRALIGIHSESQKTRKTSVLQITELQNSLIFAMAEPYKSECLQELLSPFGMVPMSIPDINLTEIEDVELFSNLTNKLSKVLSGFSYMMKNGQLGPEDIPHKAELLSDMTESIKHIEESIFAVNQKVAKKK